ncbi:MAG: SRPBCC domain-containing protein [Saprospiraceae bacterium]|nr:SRPBCC domain-containing protein [Saprospiraceae bacterium]
MRKVEVQIEIACTPAEVISCFLEPEHLQKWWGVERTLIDKKIGGMYLLAWQISEAGIKYISSGIIESFDPGSKLVIGNYVYMNPEKNFLGPMTLSIEAEIATVGCKLKVCQDGYGEGSEWDWYYEAVLHAWPVVIQTFKNYIEKDFTKL